MKILGITALLLALSGCAYDKLMESWKGQPIDDLMYAWGPPSAVQRLPGDRMTVLYASGVSQGAVSFHNGFASAYGTSFGPTFTGTATGFGNTITVPVVQSCRVLFSARNGLIENASYEGTLGACNRMLYSKVDPNGEPERYDWDDPRY